ncbi:MAG: hypothetical protein IJS93_03515 [Clostridia bacterium]|nr:hypothetical protein [Clostridia bacterium]
MKNKIYLSVISALLLFAICFSACSKIEKEQENVIALSYCQTSLYEGKNADFVVELTEGTSEKLFVADGKTQETAPFVTLKVTPTSQDLKNVDLKFKLKGDKGEVSAPLSVDAFGAYFTASPDMSVVGKPQEASVLIGADESKVELKDMLEGMVTSQQALSIAEETLKEKLANDDKEREIYVRVIKNADELEAPYYWYVAFISSPTDYYSAVIDVKSGKVASTNPQ